VTLRHAFDKAVSDAKVEEFQFRDFRHCARTRWAVAGLPFEVAETGIGHKLRGIASTYVNLSDDHIKDAFAEMFQKMATAGNGQAKNRNKIEL
jgi:integrase